MCVEVWQTCVCARALRALIDSHDCIFHYFPYFSLFSLLLLYPFQTTMIKKMTMLMMNPEVKNRRPSSSRLNHWERSIHSYFRRNKKFVTATSTDYQSSKEERRTNSNGFFLHLCRIETKRHEQKGKSSKRVDLWNKKHTPTNFIENRNSG